jgi:hypothetical protein
MTCRQPGVDRFGVGLPRVAARTRRQMYSGKLKSRGVSTVVISVRKRSEQAVEQIAQGLVLEIREEPNGRQSMQPGCSQPTSGDQDGVIYSAEPNP